MADSRESAAYQKAHLDYSIAADIIAPTVIFLTIAYIAVLLRYYSRRISNLRLGADDWCIGVGLILTTCCITLYYLSRKYGKSRYSNLIRNPQVWIILLISTQISYCISISTIKLSVLLFYDRIFGIPKPMFRYILLAMGGFVIAYGVAGILGTLLQCVPLDDMWQPPNNSPSIRIDYGTLVVAMGVVNVVTDIAILSLPMPLVWSLQVSETRRWQLVIAFSLGGLVCIISIIRLFFVKVGRWDASYDDVKGLTFSAVECCVAILSACLPTYRPLWRKYGCARHKGVAIAKESDSNVLKRLRIPAADSP